MIRTTPTAMALPAELICDRCGRVVPASDIEERQGTLQLRFTGGCGPVFGDGSRVAVDLCRHRVKALLGAYCRVDA